MFILIYLCLCVMTVNGCQKGLFGKRAPQTLTPITLTPLPPITRSSPPLDKRSDTSQALRDGDVVMPLILVRDKIVGRVAVGTLREGDEGEEQEFAMHMNLHKSTVYLPSLNCEEVDCTKLPYRTYFASKSKSLFRKEYSTFTDSHGGYGVKGFHSDETFKFGGSEKAVVLKGQEFVEVTEVLYGFDGIDGMFGLDLVSGIAPPVWNFPKDKSVKPVFGIYFNKIQNDKEIGSIVFGGKDEDLMEGTLNSHKVIKIESGLLDYTGWNIKFDKIEVIHSDGSRSTAQFHISLGIGQASEATLAPDMELIGLPGLLISATMRAIFGDSPFFLPSGDFDCKDKLKTLPKLAFVIDGHDYVLTPEEYFRPVNGKCRDPFKVASKVMLGRIFMTKYYTRFDIGKQQVQFALSSGIY